MHAIAIVVRADECACPVRREHARRQHHRSGPGRMRGTTHRASRCARLLPHGHRAGLGVVSATPLYWHLDNYPTVAAATAARQGHGTVAEAHGRVWLFTIAEADWRPQGGQRVARVGPLPLVAGRAYEAYYIEGVVPAGARTPAHRHAGPEAWYVLEGTNCLETPDGVRTASAGETLIVPEGPPMVLTGVGPTTRKSMAVIVHDAAQPWTIVTTGWTPKGACPH